MRSILSTVTAALAAVALALTVTPAASAADLGGMWNSASRRGGDIGYSMKVTSQSPPPRAYSVVLRFHYQDGKVGPRIKAWMTSTGSTVLLVLNGKGGLADLGNPNIMKGTLGQDGSLYFPTCYKQLTFINKGFARQACLFQEFAV
jgi:hypothetical protein